MPTESSVQALSILRDGSQFQWYVIPLLVIVLYVYAVEIEKRNWNVLLAGLAHLRRKGVWIVWLTVDSENQAACALYQSVGFKVQAGSRWYEKAVA